jgi:2'-5' RNA ligase
VTLARVRGRARARPLAARPPALAPFSAAALVLYRSDISRAGARYTALERLELGA